MMSIDESLQRAASTAATWSSTAAWQIASSLALSFETEVEWDEGAGEEWLRVLAGSRLVALVSIKLPFVFIKRSVNELTGSSQNVVFVAVADFDDVELSCSSAVLAEVFGGTKRLGVLDPDGFSANDLWYATV